MKLSDKFYLAQQLNLRPLLIYEGDHYDPSMLEQFHDFLELGQVRILNTVYEARDVLARVDEIHYRECLFDLVDSIIDDLGNNGWSILVGDF